MATSDRSSNATDETAASELSLALRAMRSPTDAEINEVAHTIANAFNQTQADPVEKNRIHFAFIGGFWRQKLLAGTTNAQLTKVCENILLVC